MKKKKSTLSTIIMTKKTDFMLKLQLISGQNTKNYARKRSAHLAGPAVPVGGGTGQETGVGGLAPTPTAEAAATAGCPVQSRENGKIREGK